MSAIRVLLVDDEPDIREVADISLCLDDEFEVRTCASGSEALRLAAEWSPSVILLDAEMPVMDGAATLAQLRQNSSTACIPVLFMTARALADDIARFMALGAHAVISKPFEPMTLSVLVRSYLAEPETNVTRH